MASVVLTLGYATTASAVPVYCSAVSTNKNYMAIDDSQVKGCLLSGSGNINGNPKKDPFLNSAVGAGYSFVSKSDASNPFRITFSQNGTWSFDPSFWNTHSDGAIGFKFGTGNKPDEWFVFSLEQGVSSGTWNFFNVFGRGGGLSHMTLYGITAKVPEPGTLALFGLGLMAIGFRRLRKPVSR